MRIGIFSDVHGHLAELHKTLALFEALHTDALICAGDLVDKGNANDEVITVMRERGIACVQGNHDAKAASGWLPSHMSLTDVSIDYLRQLPPALTFKWLETTVFVCHATPWHDSSVYVYPTRPAVLFQLVADAVDTDIIVLGHIHHPMCIAVEGKWLLNPGSIYGNRDREARTCGVLTLPE